MKRKRYMNLRTSKKGSLVDIPFGLFIGLIMAIAFIVTYIVITQIIPPITSAVNMDPAVAAEINDQVNNRSISIFEGMFLFMFFGFYLGSIVLSFLVDTHPIILVFAIMIWIASIPLTAIIANAYAQIHSDLSEYTIDFVIIPWVFQHYVAIIAIMGLPLLFTLYAKARG